MFRNRDIDLIALSGLSAAWTTGNTYTCNGAAEENVCIFPAVAHLYAVLLFMEPALSIRTQGWLVLQHIVPELRTLVQRSLINYAGVKLLLKRTMTRHNSVAEMPKTLV